MSADNIKKSLEELHKELGRLVPAIKHVEMAIQVTEELGKLTKHFNEGFKELERSYKGNLLLLKGDIATLQKEVKIEIEKVVGDATELFGSFETLRLELDGLKTNLEEYLKRMEAMNIPQDLAELKGKIDSISTGIHEAAASISRVEKAIKESLEKNDKIITDFSKIPAEILELLKSLDLQEQFTNLKSAVGAISRQISSLSLPERLHAIDRAIAGLDSSVHSVQSRLDSVEGNLADRLKEFGETSRQQQEAISIRITKQEELFRKQITQLKTAVFVGFGIMAVLLTTTLLILIFRS